LSVVAVDQYFDVWKQGSLASKQKIQRFDTDLAFGSTRGQRLDVFYGYENDAPTLIFIHGGYWRALDKADFSFIAGAFTSKGVNVVLTNYDLCPSVSLREICRQQAEAVAWVYRNSFRLGLNKDKIIVSGHSAGGHLSALMLTAHWKLLGNDLPVDLVKGAIALSGLFDLRPVSQAPFLAKDLRLSKAEAIRLSPAFMKPATNAPLITAVGELESEAFQRQTGLIEKAWPDNFKARIPAQGANHFSICDHFATPGDKLFEISLNLLKSI
jgi:arylformamidase